MQRRPLAVYGLLLLGSAALAAWQFYGYRQERAQIRESVHQQAHSVMNALTGGIRSHRRLGCFFEEQLQGMLDELVKSHDILAVAVKTEAGKPVLASGREDLLDGATLLEAGDYWDEGAFRLVEPFEVKPAACPAEGSCDKCVDRPPGAGPSCMAAAGSGGPFTGGGQFVSILWLDRTRSDALTQSAALSSAAVAAAGALVLLCIALAWRSTVRLIEAQGRSQVLEAEARHFRELSQAAAGLAHETRNPLGLVRGWTQRLAASELGSPDSQEHAQAVVEECDRVTARINQFLAFARPCQPETESVDIEPLLDELAMILQPDLETKSLTLRHESPGPDYRVHADRELLRQALFNLVQNAIQFAPDGDTITVAVTPGVNGNFRIDVSDHGPGVADDAVASLFTPYYTTRPNGTGLGLAIVRRIASAHGWQIHYARRPGGGSTFSIDHLS